MLAALLEIPFESRYAALNLSAEGRRRKTLEALVRLIEIQVVDKPMLLISEDLHWVDPTTEMFLGRIIEIAKNSPISMLLTHRPEYCATWGSEPHLTEIHLNHLTRNECRSLIGNITTTAGLSESLLENIVERTDGVPLFVEELSKAIIEAQDFGAIPASLRDALTARLDLLGSAKDVAQAASVLGREFNSELLPIILDIPTE